MVASDFQLWVVNEGEQVTRVSYSALVVTHFRFVYDNFLCVQRLNAANGNAVRTEFVWDPTEPIATRPLIMRAKNWGLNLFYTHDGNKNVSEVFYHALQNGIAAHYDYAPFGAVTRTARATRVTNRDLLSENPFRFSSEYHDAPLGLVYYNYRHYNPINGRWLGRDKMGEEGGRNLFALSRNSLNADYLGLLDLLDPVVFVWNGVTYVGDVVSDSAMIVWNGAYYTGKFVQTLAGTSFLVYASALDGELYNEFVSDPSRRNLTFEEEKGCTFNISVNGMANKDGTNFKNLVEAKIHQKVYPLDNPNNLTIPLVGSDGLGIGDLIQSGWYEIGGQDLLSLNFANAIYNAYQRGKKNNCESVCISVYAHSQGTMVARRGFDLLKYIMMEDEVLASVTFCGYGGETRIDANEFGLRSATNVSNPWDPISRGWGFLRDLGTKAETGPGVGHSATQYIHPEALTW